MWRQLLAHLQRENLDKPGVARSGGSRIRLEENRHCMKSADFGWSIQYVLRFTEVRDGRFGSKVGQIAPKWDKSGDFSDPISVHLAHRAKCTEI